MDLTSLDAAEIAVLVVAMIATGALAGFLAGLLGVGGGIVTVPVLFHVLTSFGVAEDIRMKIAVGTSLAMIVPTSVLSWRSHHKRGNVDGALLRRIGPAVAVGVLIGLVIASVAKGQVLTGVFAVVALAVAAHMAITREGTRLRADLPGTPGLQGLGALIGGFSVLMGIGGGTLTVPSFSLCGYPIKRAVGTASAIGLIISVPGAIGFLINGLDVPGRPADCLGYTSLIGFAMLTPTTLLLTPVGAHTAHRINPGLLRKAFALFLALTSARMFYSLLT